ncbi:MAG: SHOCT domain-containing protein [Ferruginibacter sp.]
MDYVASFCGMHLFWWLIWGTLLVWIFATPYKIPGERLKKNTPLYILQKRFASGIINNEEYLEKKRILESGLNKSFKKVELKNKNRLIAS